MNFSDDNGLLAIRVKNSPNQIAAIKIIREATQLSLVEIKTALAEQSPFFVASLFGLDHDEKESTVRTLFEQLDKAGVDIDIILNGDVESRQNIDNVLNRWREIGIHTEIMSDLESGEPCIGTLEWLQSNAPQDVFRQTIRQIINHEGYNVDPETLNWAKDQIDET